MESVHSVKSRITNGEIYALIEREPGLSKYKLGKELNWSPGKTDGSIKRLLDEKKIFIKEAIRNGRKVNLIYPTNLLPSYLVSIPTKDLEVSNPTWMDKACMYALNSTAIGVSGNYFEPWDKLAFYKKEISISHRDGLSYFGFPEEFKRFYNLDRKTFVFSLNENNILITISGDIVT